MRILYIYTALTTIGGADRVLTEKMNYLADHCGHEVFLLTDSQCGRQPVFPLSAAVHHRDLAVDFDQQYHHGFLMRGYWFLRLMRDYRRKLEQQLSEIRPDVIVSAFGRESSFADLFRRYARLTVAEVHTTKSNMRAMPLLRKRGFPYTLVAAYLERSINRAARSFDRVVVLNESERRAWQTVRSVDVIPNSLTLNPSQTASLSNLRVIFVGRAENEKGPDRMLQAWNIVHPSHPDWQLHMFSVGTQLEMLKAYAASHGFGSSVVFRQPTRDLLTEYLASSVCVMTSRFEGFGMVLLEAMACGVPCVAYDCPYGPASIIRDGEDGFLVPDGDESALVRALSRLMDDDGLRRQFGANARRNIQRFSTEAVMAQWQQLFNSPRR